MGTDSDHDVRATMRGPRALTSYTAEELREASRWPAIAHYLRLLAASGPPDQSPTDVSASSAANAFSRRLRLERHQLWLEAALATFFDDPPAQEVCFFWSNCAERLIAEAWKNSGLETGDYALLALGKLGSRELNLSSDVDLILVRADHQAPDLKAMRFFQNELSELTDFGFALRVDFTLRPGGAASPAIPSMTELENYYGYQGETWERLAFVRMRTLQGSASLRAELTSFARKYSYRKHLDYTLLEELKALRNKIRREKFETRPGVFHLKLGPGGIRELELFIHALLVIHGGRNPGLQTHSTTKAIEALRDAKLLAPDEADFLIGTYWYLRRLENRVHAFEDQQNYNIDLRNPSRALPSDFVPELQSRCTKVAEIATSLFGALENPIAADDADELPESEEDQKTWLAQKGLAPHSARDTWPELLAATALSRKSERDERARRVFLKNFVNRLAKSPIDRDLGLSLLLDFVKATRAKASFFTLLNHEPRVVDNLVLLFSTSPYLGSILTSRPELIDEFIYRKQAPPSKDFDTLLDELAERRLLAELIAANEFLSQRDLHNLSLNISDNADAICGLLLERLVQDHGPSDIGLIAMGKWGGRELGLRSDLDFVFITPDEPTANDQKIAKRFLSRITEAHRGGSIYAVDMRLRPSGHSGPILVSAAALDTYLKTQAAAWERQAYLRARSLSPAITGPNAIAAEVGIRETDFDELKMIRRRLLQAAAPGELDLKLTPGGLADIEFCAQLSLLAQRAWTLDTSTAAMIQYMESVNSGWKKAGAFVREKYLFLRDIEQLYQLTTRQSGSKIRVKSDEFKRLSSILGATPTELENRIRLVMVQVQEELAPLRIN